MSVKHTIHHKGSPRLDKDNGFFAIAGITLAIGALIMALPYLLAVGAIGGGTYLLLNTNFVKIKFKTMQLDKLAEKIENSIKDKDNIQKTIKELSKEDQITAINYHNSSTKTLIRKFDNKRNEILVILRKSLSKLNSDKQKVIKKVATLNKKKLTRNIEKLEDAIKEINCSINKLESISFD